ncbi:Acetyltransferase (GNAT) domain-containing protein [Cryobacterium psychrotolerans]|uniref:Acetyltransferase (GNAT) domain-containing protein n=1 Tax=Cryobacterium psychrotolerans TaxID=386301 RepID=A0A1G9GS77_9MICO|nr:Acetyltransferase (GNAT) domain-containing protein [Cryobacterium psychrotolerans]
MPGGVPGGVEVGWRLAREAWGQGYATEAAKAALAVAFDELRLDEVNSITAVLNAPSRAVMVRLGMTLSDEFELPRIAAGSPLRPHLRYLLARPEH